MKLSSGSRPLPPSGAAFAGFRFPAEVIVVAVRWYLRYGLSYRDVEELLVERGVEVDHVTVYRWVQRFTPLLADAARFARHSPGDRWFVDETYVKVNGVWRYVYRAVDQYGQVIDVLVSKRRDAARGPPVLHTGADHVEGDARLRWSPTRRRSTRGSSTSWSRPRGTTSSSTRTTGSKPTTADSNTGYDPCAAYAPTAPPRSSSPGLAFVQNLRRGHYELATEAPRQLRVAAAFTELANAI